MVSDPIITAAHACVQAEALRVGAERFMRMMRFAQLTTSFALCAVPNEGEHFAPRAWPGCDAVTG